MPFDCYNPSACRTQKLSKLHPAKQIVPKERATEIIVCFSLREIELQSKLITLLKRPLFLISFCTAAEAPRPTRALLMKGSFKSVRLINSVQS